MNAPVPPTNLDAEESVLGAIMLSSNVILAVEGIVRPEDFYRESHATIFRAAVRLFGRGLPTDCVTVVDELEKAAELDKAGGIERVHELAALVPATANAAHHAGIVRDKAVLRSVIFAGQNIAEMGLANVGSADEVLEEASRVVHNLVLKANGHVDIAPIGVGSKEFIDRLQRRKDGDRGTQIGFRSFDRMSTGLRPGNLMVLAAGTSVGKSSFAVSTVNNIAVKGRKPVAMFTLEMSRDEIYDRLASVAAQVELQQIRTGEIDPESWRRLLAGVNEVDSAPLFVDDSPGVSLNEVRAKLRRLKLRQPDLALAVVDYLQLMTPPGGESRYEQVTQIARGLKHLAQEVQVPIMALSQLNRNREQRADKRPILSDLRESGEIEQAADVVAFVHRADKESMEADLLVEKQRNGPTGHVPLVFTHRYALFTEAFMSQRDM